MPRTSAVETGAKYVTYHGHKLLAVSPSDGIPLSAAAKRFGMSTTTIWKLIDEDGLKAGLQAPRGRSPSQRIPRVMVSRRGLERLAASRNTRRTKEVKGPPPSDGVPVGQLARELEFDPNVLSGWCKKKWHPALDRALRSGIGEYTFTSGTRNMRWRGLLVSRADATACVNAVRDPLIRIPANKGVWLSDGVFQHDDDGELYFTQQYVLSHPGVFGITKRLPHDPSCLKKLRRLKVWFLGTKKAPWVRQVFARQSLMALAEARKGRVVNNHDGKEVIGQWLVPGDLWADGEGLWYSSRLVARRLGRRIQAMHHLLRATGSIRFKEVPRPAGEKGQPPIVHHQRGIHPLLGIGGESPGSAQPEGPPRERRKKRSRDKHLWWKELREKKKLSWGAIAREHKAEYGVAVTIGAIRDALKKLKNDGE